MAETPTITVTLDASESNSRRWKVLSGLFEELPEVRRHSDGCYTTGKNVWDAGHRDGLDDLIRHSLAIRLAMLEDDAKAEQEAKEAKEAEAKQAHDELRTSPVALKALALYNEDYAEILDDPYPSWDAINSGVGAKDEVVRYWIERVEGQEAERLTARRDQLVQDHVGHPATYDYCATPSTRSLVDRIIALQDRLVELEVQA